MLLGNKTVGKPVYFPFNWCDICKEHAFGGWAAELSMWVAPMKNVPNEKWKWKMCQIFSANAKQLILLLLLTLVLSFWYPQVLIGTWLAAPVSMGPATVVSRCLLQESACHVWLIWIGQLQAGVPQNQVAALFGVSPSTISKLKAKSHITGDVRDRLRSKGGRYELKFISRYFPLSRRYRYDITKKNLNHILIALLS